MEGYPGAVILATNFRRNIDDAFIRRLDFVIDFPFPEKEDRKRIWQKVLPPEAPVADDIDLDFLSEKFKLSGGAIRNCSLAGAFEAADEDSPIGMRHLVARGRQRVRQAGPPDPGGRLRLLPRRDQGRREGRERQLRPLADRGGDGAGPSEAGEVLRR